MTILLIGADGQLGSELRQAFSDQDLVPLTHADLELTDPARVLELVRQYRPGLILNTAAYHRVDECEGFPERAFAVNAVAIRDLAIAAKEIGAALVHFSTDYVFDGRQRNPYREVDPPGPLSVYATSKLAGEHLVMAVLPQHFVIRTSGLYGPAGRRNKTGNFVETMLRLAREGREIRVVGDQIVTPTSAEDLARKVRQLVETGAYGLYHITNNGECSWHQFASAIFDMTGLHPRLQETTAAAFAAPARRPAYSVLDNANLRSLGLDDLRHWREALADYLAKRARLLDQV
ncbi:Spore coat polysaccharide biosynthesis protein spsK [Candidatus Methylomirabilis lanthanidiphila]|uniref:dTDP-4-dehydrorhamnose reductase n=1 Tax=Candidatus Methylomirabilis lanthanidiphila TaxID=2211376 RepID=A0A564ZIC1_9BACT|nr:dTDP-4-dehydrorhamnose reductase [Candidatus Methylomirabilis lanthanidiphila]VUZ84913.1 Spore coat polysaccharide biosynthesis protein spsK [Candidatus Methylomirabilis lanthanidiphila]